MKIFDECLRKLETPCFSIESGLLEPWYKTTLIVNPTLRSYQFFKVIDPFTAYQELSMFLGNNLVTQKDPNPPISDVDKRDTHGFNEWSFKTHQEESKKPRGKKKI